MKKYLLGLLLMVMFVPGVFAATSITLEDKDACLAGEMCETEVSLYITSDDVVMSKTDELIADLTMAEGVKVARTINSDLFTVTEGTNQIIFTPKDDFMGDGTKVLLGKVVFEYASNIEDCSVVFTFKKYEQTKEVTITTSKEVSTTVQTGISMPLAIISTISLLGIGAYLVSKRSTKFHKV